ncbi:MAG: hypothetical protein MZU79_08660 [Anaerotruncus sp.]|nr:hypothetical protein [Anaerotruncus sp.]
MMPVPVDVSLPFVGLPQRSRAGPLSGKGRRIGQRTGGRSVPAVHCRVGSDPASGSSWGELGPGKPVTWDTVLQLMDPSLPTNPHRALPCT